MPSVAVALRGGVALAAFDACSFCRGRGVHERAPAPPAWGAAADGGLLSEGHAATMHAPAAARESGGAR